MTALPIKEFGYGDVTLAQSLQKTQFTKDIAFLMEVSEDSMLRPYRERAGLPTPGAEIGGWYENNPAFDWRNIDWRGFAPGHCFGQWLSALSRAYAITGQDAIKSKVLRLVRAYEQTISS